LKFWIQKPPYGEVFVVLVKKVLYTGEHMSKKVLLCIIILFFGAGFIWWWGEQTQNQESTALSESGIEFGYQKATSTSKVSRIVAPDFTHTLSGASTSTRSAYEKVIARLRIYPNDTDSWIALGLYRKESDDYKGAEAAWNYASVLDPANPQPYDNLGVLYGYYLHNNTLAEQNYLKAIEKEPFATFHYLRAVEFYREVLKDSTKAHSIVEKGLKLMPQNSDLLALQAELK